MLRRVGFRLKPVDLDLRAVRRTVCSARVSPLARSKAIGRREILPVAAVGLYLTFPVEGLALPRGGIDARVAAAFNTAFAAGGDPVVRLSAYRSVAARRRSSIATTIITGMILVLLL